MTTKKQEREALEQIKSILETLGAESYVSTALEGCLEIAEQNIDNDFACSMKQRAESAENKASSLEITLKDVTKTAEEAVEEIHRLQEELKQAKNRQINPRLYRTIWENAFDQKETSRRRMMAEADMMANLSESPQDIAFQQAVKAYRKSKKQADDAAWIMDQIEKIKPGGC